MAYCTKCGTQTSDNAAFCPSCGAAQNKSGNGYHQGGFQETVNHKDTFGDFFEKVKDFFTSTEDSTYKFSPGDIENTKLIGAAAYIIFFLPLITNKESPFGKYHANQGLLLFLCFVVSNILRYIPFVGGLLAFVAHIALIAVMVLQIVNTFGGKAKALPLIGHIELIK